MRETCLQLEQLDKDVEKYTPGTAWKMISSSCYCGLTFPSVICVSSPETNRATSITKVTDR